MHDYEKPNDWHMFGLQAINGDVSIELKSPHLGHKGEAPNGTGSFLRYERLLTSKAKVHAAPLCINFQ